MGSNAVLPSLNRAFSAPEVSMSLTEAGLLASRVEMIVRLYAEHHSWSAVKEKWHEERIHERGSRGSAQKIFRILKRRLQSGGKWLPSVTELHSLVQECPTEQAKAQLFYFYLIREDNLFRFVLHEVLRRQGTEQTEWHLTTGEIVSVLDHFEYEDGSGLQYADSTLQRWGQGFRSVLRDIGVLKGPYDENGVVPSVDEPPAHVGALYSWHEDGKEWPDRPVGWLYLFQPPAHRETLLDMIQSSGRWTTSRLRDQSVIAPADREEESV
ncbi:BrxA family protein [Salinibacter ruber]|uniref:BrxA family protein n=2 Tax=Salinibacter ruber TaxID=146919 RepID=UPI00311A96FE